ncbi:hypothetical protein [Streptomyces agglomeratus]|uniref:hypothetical protein n=1 Tax=Streptomyces agglomeratus TaxID=285458 RepID=UPI000A5F15F1|nr:hypothetical protein [Streptomyces agglomeratus]
MPSAASSRSHRPAANPPPSFRRRHRPRLHQRAIVRNATIEELQAAGVHVHTPEAQAEAEEAATTLAELLLKYAVKHHGTLAALMNDEDLIEYDRLGVIVAAGADRFLPHD